MTDEAAADSNENGDSPKSSSTRIDDNDTDPLPPQPPPLSSLKKTKFGTTPSVSFCQTNSSEEPAQNSAHYSSLGPSVSERDSTLFMAQEERAAVERSKAPSLREDSVTGTAVSESGTDRLKLFQRSEGARRLKKTSSVVSTTVFSNLRSTTSERARVIREQKQTSGWCPIFFPWDKRYKAWWGFTVVASILTIFVETYGIAFTPAGLPNPTDVNNIMVNILSCVFIVDMAVSFNLAFYAADGQVVTDRSVIAREYFRFFFWVDILGVFPFYPVALAMTGQFGQDSRLAQYLSLLRLTRMVRLHRIKQLFDVLQLTSKVSLLWLTLMRNLSAAVIYTHFGACAMHFVSRQYEFDSVRTMIGMNYWELNNGTCSVGTYVCIYMRRSFLTDHACILI
jgi:hypothetical protein